MAKDVTALELALSERPPGAVISEWLYQELRRAILDGRLRRGVRLPATRDVAQQYGVSRGTVVSVFGQLQDEGYLSSRVGAGTWVSAALPEDVLHPAASPRPAGGTARPASPMTLRPARPLRANEPALDRFPMDVWARVSARRLRRASVSLLAGGDRAGYRPLREAIADYLGTSRGARCVADQIVVVSGTQFSLDLVARLLVRPGNAVWMEEPGYSGAAGAFQRAGAELIPVPVDEKGLDVAAGRRLRNQATAAYVTPGHQFPMGVTMSLERRRELLEWAGETGAIVVEDDYDSEYRFAGAPVPSLQGLDSHGSVVLLGSFNKVMFPALRLGYAVLPPSLIEPMLELRFAVDRHPPSVDQAILCDFITEGHLGRHLRRMRELYAERFCALYGHALHYLDGLAEVPLIQAGLNAPAILKNGMTGLEAQKAASARGIEAARIDRFAWKTRPLEGLLLGFAAFEPEEIRGAILGLAQLLERGGATS